MNDSEKHTEPLSSDGRRRREQMLPTLQAEMSKLHRRRFQIRAGLTLASLFIVGLAWTLSQPPAALPPNDGIVEQVLDANEPVNIPIVEANNELEAEVPVVVRSAINISVVRNRADSTDKYSVSRTEPKSKLRFEPLDDDGLSTMIAEMGKPVIVGRIDGELRMVPMPGL